MAVRLLFIILLIPFTAIASNAGIEDYIPPPMFEDSSVVRIHNYPPLPPRRPDIINVPQSYIDFMREHGHAPALIQPSSGPINEEILRENLVQPSAQDILDQINPQ